MEQYLVGLFSGSGRSHAPPPFGYVPDDSSSLLIITYLFYFCFIESTISQSTLHVICVKLIITFITSDTFVNGSQQMAARSFMLSPLFVCPCILYVPRIVDSRPFPRLSFVCFVRSLIFSKQQITQKSPCQNEY